MDSTLRESVLVLPDRKTSLFTRNSAFLKQREGAVEPPQLQIAIQCGVRWDTQHVSHNQNTKSDSLTPPWTQRCSSRTSCPDFNQISDIESTSPTRDIKCRSPNSVSFFDFSFPLNTLSQKNLNLEGKIQRKLGGSVASPTIAISPSNFDSFSKSSFVTCMTPTSTSTVSTTSFSKKDSLRFEELKISPVERRVKRQLRFLTSAKTSGKKPLSLPNESLFLGLDSENMTYLDEKSHQQLLSNVSKTEKHHSKDMTSDRTPIVPVGDMDCSNKYANIASDAIIDMYHPDIGQILDFLFIGSIEAAYNDSLLNKLKVRSVVDVSNVDFTDVSSYRKAISPSQTQNFRTRLCIGLSQEGRDNISVFFDDVNKFIEGARKANRKVLVHCFRGRSRGPAMIVQYLMQFHGMNLDNAHRFICEKWPRVDIHPNYFKKLRQLDKNLKSSSKRREHNPLFRRTAWS